MVNAVLLLLNTIIINQGYGFRRDQYINMKIRKITLCGDYEEIFGELYRADDKSWNNFLPDFHNIFFRFIVGFQIAVIILISIKDSLINFSGNSFALILFVICVLLMLFSFCIKCCYYCKYSCNIKSRKDNSFDDFCKTICEEKKSTETPSES